MPTLPKANTLDYNPDSIISASKKLRIVQSSQMKDAEATDATLRPVKDDKTTTGLVKTFVDKIAEIGDIFNFVRTQSATLGWRTLDRDSQDAKEEGAGRDRLARMYGGMDPADDELSVVSSVSSTRAKRPVGRPKKQIDPTGMAKIETYFSRLAGNPQEPPRVAKLSKEDIRARAEARGQSRSATRLEEAEDIADNEGDLDEEEMANEAEDIDEEVADVEEHESEERYNRILDDVSVEEVQLKQNIISGILRLTKLMREADSIILSIKPKLKYVTPDEIEEIKMAYNVLIRKWDTLREPIKGFPLFELFYQIVDYSAEMLKVLNDERMKLMTDIITVVNSYNSNEAVQPNFVPSKLIQPIRTALDTSEDPELETKDIEKYLKPKNEKRGAGRNFYGEQIGHSRDLPTIFSGAMRNCPTKYLL